MQIFWSLEDMKYAQGKILNHENAEKIIQFTAKKTILKLITSTKTFYNYLSVYDVKLSLHNSPYLVELTLSSNPWNGKNEYVTQFQLVERLQ